MSIGNVEQVFDPAALVETELITNGLLYDDVVGLPRGQNLIDVLRRSHGVHLVSLQAEAKRQLWVFSMCGTFLSSAARHTHVFTPPEKADVGVQR